MIGRESCGPYSSRASNSVLYIHKALLQEKLFSVQILSFISLSFFPNHTYNFLTHFLS